MMVRDVAFQRRDGDLVAGTFGRGVYILDDYQALREVTAQSLAARAEIYPARDAYIVNELNQLEASWGNTDYPNPPAGALLTYSVGQGGGPADDQIADDQGKVVRRIELTGEEATPGLHRVNWDLRPDPANGAAAGGGRRRRLRPRQLRPTGGASALHGVDRHEERRRLRGRSASPRRSSSLRCPGTVSPT